MRPGADARLGGALSWPSLVDLDVEGHEAVALLDATNRFLTAANPDELGAAVMATAATLFQPWKAALIVVDDDGAGRVLASSGFSSRELGMVADLVEAGTPVAAGIARGDVFWSDVPDDGQAEGLARLSEFGARSGFSLPVAGRSGIRGVIGVVYQDDRAFPEHLRGTADNFASQVGLALELLLAREDLRANAAELEAQTRVTSALFGVSQRMATVTALDEVPEALAKAIRSTTGASFSLVGRWNDATGRLEFAAVDGVPPGFREHLEAIDATPDRYAMIRGGLEGRANVRVGPFDPDDLPVELMSALSLTAIAGAPIKVDGRVWGLIAVATRDGDPSIVETGAELLSGLASIASSAIGRTEAGAALARQADVLESTVAERTLQLQQAVDELRLASQAKTEFLANVSHELRTPLTAILGFTDLLSRGLDQPLTTHQLDDVKTIDDNGRRLLALIDDLISVARLDAGRITLDVAPIAIGELVVSTVEEFRPLAEQKGLSLRYSDRDLPATVVADAPRLHEILLNLLSNAVKFTPAGGSVRVTAIGEPGQVRITIEDTGIGIAAEHQSRVFDKFQRISGPEYPGTGLGLAIARELARLHGGDLTLESALGLGSRFTVTLPIEGAGGSPA